MEIRNINTFLQIVESGSFSKTAQILGYTQSTVSFQIQQLESELNCKLFDRIGRNVTLTDKGKQFLHYALNVNHSMQELIDNFQNEDEIKGTIRIASSDSICEKMMLLNYQEFYEKYPNIKLIFTTGTTTNLLSKLDHNEADIVFTLDNHIYRNEYTIARESPVQLNFVTNINNPLVNKENVTIQDIMEYPLLLTEQGLSYRKVLDDYLTKNHIQIEAVLETGRTDVILNCLEHGNGISYLPDFVSKEKVENNKMKTLNVKDIDMKIWKQLIYRKDKWISKALREFIEFVVAHEFEW